LAAALGLAFLSTAARADWVMKTADFKEVPHLTVNTWTVDEGLSATDVSGKLVTFPTRDVLSLYSGQKMVSDPASRAWRLSLRNGDVLYGDAMGISGKSLVFKIPDFGELAVPLKRVSMLSAPVYGAAGSGDKPKKIPAAADHDIVVFRETGDQLEGLVTAIDGDKISFAAVNADSATDISLNKIDTLVFGGAKPPREIPPLSMRFTMVSGSVYTVPLEGVGGQKDALSWQLSKVTIKDSAGRDHTASADRIITAELLGGRVVYLTELDFAKEEQVSFLGTNWPAQINRNALGLPLRVAHNAYEHGIGVHTQSTLYYELDGSFDTLTLRVGLDDSAAPLGEAQASIVLDGKKIWEAKMLKPGEISQELSLPIKGGKKLELHADPTDRLDVQGRVDWVDVALRRK
jgi:hypothetical protein